MTPNTRKYGNSNSMHTISGSAGGVLLFIAGQQETTVVLQVLTQSMQPMLTALHSWLYAGLLNAAAQDFFICEGQLIEPAFLSILATQRVSSLTARHLAVSNSWQRL